MPTVREMFINLTGTALDAYSMLKERGVVFADKETSLKRIDICLTCPHFITDPGPARCGVCGCGMKMKVRIAAAQCPINPPKWDKLSEEDIRRIKTGNEDSL